jgi:hypothetical protein
MAIRWSWCVTTRPARGSLGALDLETVGELFGTDPDRAQVGDQRGDPVALLDPELLGAGDARHPLGARGEDREDRDLVDAGGDPGPADLRGAERGRAGDQVRHGLSVRQAFGVDADPHAHPPHHVDEPGARRVHADVGHAEFVGAAERREGDQEGRG